LPAHIVNGGKDKISKMEEFATLEVLWLLPWSICHMAYHDEPFVHVRLHMGLCTNFS